MKALTALWFAKEDTKIDRVRSSICVCGWGDFCKTGTSQMGLGLKRAVLVRIVCLVLKGIFKRTIQIKLLSSHPQADWRMVCVCLRK